MFEIASVLTQLVNLFAIAGGGGSSGGGGGGGFSGGSSSGGSGSGGDGWSFVIFVVIFLLILYFAYRGGRIAARKLAERRAEMKSALETAAAADIIWDPDTIEGHAKNTFIQYQKDWSAFDLDSMKKYMTPRYYQHNLLMMGALKLLNRQNDVQNPVVTSAEIYQMTDSKDNKNDANTIQLQAHVHDVLNDTADHTQLFAQDLTTTEYYRFIRSGKTWSFDGIDQETADPNQKSYPMYQFAEKNGFFYSLDWGHLLLPRRGQLFNKGTFGTSDINNHVIGLYHDIIIQMYTYVPVPGGLVVYLIAQTAVPKSYGNIVVRNKEEVFSPKGGSGLRKIKMEWQEFNDKYEVYASDEELATSFELLNPKFMEQLEALPFRVNIEVVDNIVYLHTSTYMQLAMNDNYAMMLDVLKAAFKEMRM